MPTGRVPLWAVISGFLIVAAASVAAADRGRLLENRESLYNNIFIYGDGSNVHMTFGRENWRYFTESSINLSDPGALTLYYSRYMTLGIAYAAKAERILEIGLGGGRTASYLNAAMPDASIVTVELDKDVVDLAKKYFQFTETAKLRTVVSDGRSFLMRDGGGWDVILLDAYRGPFVPFHLLTKEFYTLVKSRLAPGGVAVQNIEPTTMLYNSATATFNSVFSSVDLYDCKTNVVAVGYDGPSLRQSDLMARAARAQATYRFRYDLRVMARERRVLKRPNGKIMSDDFAPVETLRAIDQSNEKWKDQTESPR
jgi:spermidine synthase